MLAMPVGEKQGDCFLASTDYRDGHHITLDLYVATIGRKYNGLWSCVSGECVRDKRACQCVAELVVVPVAEYNEVAGMPCSSSTDMIHMVRFHDPLSVLSNFDVCPDGGQFRRRIACETNLAVEGIVILLEVCLLDLL